MSVVAFHLDAEGDVPNRQVFQRPTQRRWRIVLTIIGSGFIMASAFLAFLSLSIASTPSLPTLPGMERAHAAPPATVSISEDWGNSTMVVMDTGTTEEGVVLGATQPQDNTQSTEGAVTSISEMRVDTTSETKGDSTVEKPQDAIIDTPPAQASVSRPAAPSPSVPTRTSPSVQILGQSNSGSIIYLDITR